MRDRRSYLESVNAGRRRRAGTSLDDLDSTLDELENRLGRASGDVDREAAFERRARRPLAEDRFHEASRRSERGAAAQPHSAIAGEMQALREELRQQMNAGLRREFAALRGEIERALASSAPRGQAAELGAEFERLSSMIHRLSEESDDRQAQMLRLEMEEMKRALGQLAREETVRSFDRRWGDLDRRFSDMAGTLAAAPRGGADPALKALAARIEEIGGAVSALPTSGALRSLEDKMKVLQAAVDRFSREQERPGPAMGAEMLDIIGERLDELSRAVAASSAAPRAAFDPEPFERIEARISSLARQIGEVALENPARDLTDQLAALSERVEDLARRVDVPERAVERLAGQIEAIAERFDHAPALPNLDAVFAGLENRLASMSNLLEQRHEDALAQGRALFHDLENRLDDVAARLRSEQAGPGHDGEFIAAMDARFAELAARFERQAAAPQADDRAIRDLEKRLDTISHRIESSVAAPAVDTDLIRSLESQIAGLAEHISRPAAAQDAGEDIRPRLDKIEQSIAESRKDVLEAARRAAEEAGRSFSGPAAESALVAGLADDLKSLEALTRKSDDRNAKTFEAIHDTLLKIVDRLGAVEAAGTKAAAPQPTMRDVALGAARTPSLAPSDEALPLPTVEAVSAAAAHEDTEAVRSEAAPAPTSLLGGLARALSSRKGRPDAKSKDKAGSAVAARRDAAAEAPAVEPDLPLDPQLANRPLEPGSGAPDLNAIMRRVRDERGQPGRTGTGDAANKADFIAAARRAAQAAAAEAETMKNRPAAKSGGGKFNPAAFLRSRRKPLLMGVAAILLALAALQGGRMVLGSGGDSVARTPAAQPATVAKTAPEETPEPVETAAAIETPAPQVRMAGEPAPAAAARSAIAVPPESAEEIDGDWLDLETTAAAPTREDAAPAETRETIAEAPAPAAQDEPAAEVESLPEPTAEELAAIPLEAGPVALREAAAAGDPKALFEIGNRYAEGRGVAEDMAKAASWYEKAAEQGLAPAQYRVGSFYEKGVGVARDVAKAKHWYLKAAESGNASAMHNLAVLHAMGADGTSDNDAAARWFLRAAELGVRDSQFNLGILSAKGVGMPQNLQEAYKWFALVAKAGDKDAAEKRDEIAKALRPEQLETARAAAELWRVKELDAEANSVEIPESWSESQGTTASVDMRAAMRNIQQILNKNGYQAGAEDGIMGQKTKTAIAAFQKDNGMAPTGEVDEALVRALLERR